MNAQGNHKSKQVAERRVHQACMVIDTEKTTMAIEISEVKVALKNGLHGPYGQMGTLGIEASRIEWNGCPFNWRVSVQEMAGVPR